MRCTCEKTCYHFLPIRSSGQSSSTTPRRLVGSNSCSSLEHLGKSAPSPNKAFTPTSDILVLDADGRLADTSCFGEIDRSVTEMTYVNEEITRSEFMVHVSSRSASAESPVEGANGAGDSGSDSGYSDPSTEHQTVKTPTSTLEVEAEISKSPLSDIDSLDIVPSSPARTSPSSPSGTGTRPRSSRSSPKHSIRSSGSRKSSGSKVAVEDEVERQSNLILIVNSLTKSPIPR